MSITDNARAEAWDECAQESYERGWMHDYARDDMKGRNPHRAETTTATTEDAERTEHFHVLTLLEGGTDE